MYSENETTQINRNTTNNSNISTEDSFKATIKKIYTNNIIVQGFPENKNNHQDEFDLFITNNTIILKNGKEIKFEDLIIDTEILITYTGFVSLVSPAFIENVKKIQVLDI